MAWMKNGRPDFEHPAIARLMVGLIWGVALALLDPFAPQRAGDQGPRLIHFTLLWMLLTAPFVLLAGLGHMRRLTLQIWTVVAAPLAAGLVLHDLTRQAIGGGRPFPSGLLIPMTAVFFFALHQWVAAADEARRWIPPYDRLFGQATRQAVQFGLSVALTVLFWGVLNLGAALFGLIGLKGFGEIIARPWFSFPATTLVFALAVQLSDLRAELIEGLKTFGLALLSWLGPLLTGLTLAFLVSLPFVGLQPLWATKAATPILLTAAIMLIALINAAYQDGRREPPPPSILRFSARAAALLTVPLVGLAAYATALRIGQYGLTPDRVIAVAVVLVAGLVALGYAVAALSPGPWMKRLEPANLAGLVLALAVALALFSPLADPARLSVDSQMARLNGKRIAPERFDFEFLARGGQRYGQAALKGLAQRKDRIGELARLQKKPSQAPPAPEFASPQYVVYPKGAVLPADFLATKWRSNALGSPACEAAYGGPCDAFMIDLDGDGVQEILLQIVTAKGIVGRMEIYRREATGWLHLGGATAMLCAGDLETLRGGSATTAPSRMRDLVVNGRRIGVEVEDNCQVDPAPPQLDNKGGRLNPWTF